MKVRRLPKDPGPAAWDVLLGPRQATPALEADTTADWLVIGAGFAGLAAAHRLAELHPTDTISVLEASGIAQGPAGRNSGFMIDLPHDLTSDDYGGDADRDRRDIRFNRAGIAFAKRLAAQLDLPDEAFSPVGKINGAASPRGVAHNQAYTTHLDALGEAYEELDATAMRAVTGTSYYQNGVFTAGTVMLQPALFVRGLAAGLVSNRVVLYENSPVRELSSKDGTWCAATPKGSVRAPRVILAVNGHAESFGHFTQRLMHVFTYASMTRQLTADEADRLGGHDIWGITPADPLGTTVRRIGGTGGDRIIIRNRATFDPSMEVSDTRIAAVGRDHDRAFAARFPMLPDVTMDYRWGGRLCLSRNGVPAFGEVQPGLYAACCQNGLGTAKGMASGLLAAELASGCSSDLLDDTLALAPPAKLPFAPIAKLGADIVMRWGEYRAGREF